MQRLAVLVLCTALLGGAAAQDMSMCGEPLTLDYCRGKASMGLYPNPIDCGNDPCAATYIVCTGGVPRVMPCSPATVFHPASSMCIKAPTSCLTVKTAVPKAPAATTTTTTTAAKADDKDTTTTTPPPAPTPPAAPKPSAPTPPAAPKPAAPTAAANATKAAPATPAEKSVTTPTPSTTKAEEEEEDTPVPAPVKEEEEKEESTPAPVEEDEEEEEEESTLAPVEEDEEEEEEESTPAPVEEDEEEEEESTPAPVEEEEEESTPAPIEEDEEEEESTPSSSSRGDGVVDPNDVMTRLDVQRYIQQIFAPPPTNSKDAFDTALKKAQDLAREEAFAPAASADDDDDDEDSSSTDEDEEAADEEEEVKEMCRPSEFSFDIVGEVDGVTLDDVANAISNATGVRVKGLEMNYAVRVGIVMKDFYSDVEEDLVSPLQMVAKKIVLYSQGDDFDEGDINVIGVYDKIDEDSVSIRSNPCPGSKAPSVSNTVVVDLEVSTTDGDSKSMINLEDAMIELPDMKGKDMKKMLKKVVNEHESGFKSPKELQKYVKKQLAKELAVVTGLVAKPVISIPNDCKNLPSKVKNAISDSFASGDFADNLDASVGEPVKVMAMLGRYSVTDIPGVEVPAMAASPAGSPESAPAPCPAPKEKKDNDEKEAMDLANGVANGTLDLKEALPPLPSSAYNETLSDEEEANAAAAGGAAGGLAVLLVAAVAALALLI